jgi:hypothetical protein
MHLEKDVLKYGVHLSSSSVSTYFSVFCTRNPAITAIVVGRLAAHTPSLFRVFSSILDATTKGGAH